MGLFSHESFTADLHIHTDPGHGMTPSVAAQRIIAANLDAFAITEHNRRPDGRFFEVMEEVARLSRSSRKRLFGLVGVEISLRADGEDFHVGYLFEGDFRRETLPDVPPRYCGLAEIEALRRAHRGVGDWRERCS